MSEATAFSIEEVTGPDLRRVSLTSYALPIGTYELRGTMRAEFCHYPGNPDATVQVLGAMEEPTTVGGKWSDRFLGGGTRIFLLNDAPITTAREASSLIDDIRRKGQLLKVTWDETIRYGILTEFVQRWERAQDVEWEMTLSWVSQDRSNVLSPVVSTVDSPDDVVTRVGQLIEDTIKQNSIAGEVSDVMASAQGAVTDVRRGLARAADLNAQAQGFISATASVIAAPGQVARQTAGLVLGIATQTANTLNTAKLAIRAAYTFEGTTAAATGGYGTGDSGADATLPQNGDAPAGGSSTGVGTTPASSAGKVLADSIVGVAKVGTTTGPSAAGKLLSAAVWGVKTEGGLRVLARQSAVAAQTLITEHDRDLLAIYVAREGDDLRDVARIYYGDQRYWRDLATFNDLTDSKLTKGQQVFVPRQREAAEAAYGTT
jgi:hypothetical protein